MGVITLLTDFGTRDVYAGVMKGVILGINPDASIVDITHEVEPQDVREAAFLIDDAWWYFPAGTVHVVVIDPTVGSSRRPIAVLREGHVFLGPDNGIFSLILSDDCQVRVVENHSVTYRNVSSTFHGRDIFSPAAAHLSRGFPFTELGRKVNDPVLLDGLQPRVEGKTLTGMVVRFDRFGNAITNIKNDELRSFTKGGAFTINIGSDSFTEITASYFENDRACLVGSSGYLEFAIFKGNYKQAAGVEKGLIVTVRVP